MSSWKETRRALRRPFETAGYRLLGWTIPLLPRGGVVALARGAAALAMALPLRERRVGLANLDAVFGATKSPAEKRAILRRSLATFAQTMLDVFWFSNAPEKRVKKYVAFEESPNSTRFFEDRAAICVTAHLGSWEVMGQAAALFGVDMASIAAPVKNKRVDRILIEQRERTGQTIIPRKGALRTLLGRLRRQGKVAFVLDQNTNPADGGIRVRFLGLPMTVSPAPATLAYRTGTEIHLGFCVPRPGGRYTIRISEIIPPPAHDPSRDVAAVAAELTQRVEDSVSAFILRHPEYWLWSYKHWRRQEGETYPPHFPDY